MKKDNLECNKIKKNEKLLKEIYSYKPYIDILGSSFHVLKLFKF